MPCMILEQLSGQKGKAANAALPFIASQHKAVRHFGLGIILPSNMMKHNKQPPFAACQPPFLKMMQIITQSQPT